MENRQTAMIVTIVAVVICGCPGLLSLCMGAMFAVISQIPNADIDVFGSSDPGTALGAGIGMVCAGVLFVAIPAAIGFFTLRKKPAAAGFANPNEPLPPAI
jgi:hypothetical protein